MSESKIPTSPGSTESGPLARPAKRPILGQGAGRQNAMRLTQVKVRIKAARFDRSWAIVVGYLPTRMPGRSMASLASSSGKMHRPPSRPNGVALLMALGPSATMETIPAMIACVPCSRGKLADERWRLS
jgi:hypothetical protein